MHAMAPRGSNESHRLVQPPIDETMQDFMRVCGRYNNLKQQLLNYLIALAMADGELDQSEQDVLAKIARHLGFSAALFEQFIQMIKAQSQFRGSHAGSGRPSKDQLDYLNKLLQLQAQPSPRKNVTTTCLARVSDDSSCILRSLGRLT